MKAITLSATPKLVLLDWKRRNGRNEHGGGLRAIPALAAVLVRAESRRVADEERAELDELVNSNSDESPVPFAND